MADSSFDVVSKIDRQEVDNALNQAAKELATRFDFRGTDTKIAWKGEEAIELTSSTEERLKAAVDVFKEKLIRRDISLKAFDAGEPQASGKTYKVTGALKQGITSENANARTIGSCHGRAQSQPRRPRPPRARPAISRLAQIENTVSSVGKVTKKVRNDCRNLNPAPISGSPKMWCNPTGNETTMKLMKVSRPKVSL